MRPTAAAAALVLLAGCPICPTPEMRVAEGNAQGFVLAADLVQLEAAYGDWRAGREDCGAHWYVNGIEGGNAEVGTIDACGLYRAPARFPSGLDRLDVLAAEYEVDTCMDCCPYAAIVLHVVH